MAIEQPEQGPESEQATGQSLPLEDEHVNEYLNLVEQYGIGHRKVSAFLQEHAFSPELKEWAAVANELAAKARSVVLRHSLARSVWVVSAVSVPLLIVGAIYSLIGLNQTRADLTNAQQKVAILTDKLDRKEKELSSYANAKEEIEKANEAKTAAENDRETYRVNLARANDTLASANAQIAQLQVQAGTFKNERDSYEKGLSSAKKDLDNAKKDRDRYKEDLVRLNERLQRVQVNYDTYRNALLVVALSRISALGMPHDTELLRKLSAEIEGAGSAVYARAILSDYTGERAQYLRALQRVIDDKNDPWKDLAGAERKSLDGQPEAMIDWLVALEKKIANSGYGDATSLSFLLTEQEVSYQAVIRLNREDKGHMARALAQTVGGYDHRNDYRSRLTASVPALGALGPSAREAVPMLMPLLEDRSSMVRWQTAHALAEIGPAANRAEVLLKDMVNKDSDSSVRAQAGRALARIGASLGSR